MPGRVLLDTSVLVDLLRGDDSLTPQLENADEVFTSIVVLGELLYGARRSDRFEQNRQAFDALVQDLTALPCDRLTAEIYSRIKDRLRRRGRPIPDNDLWIAATAAQHGLQLVSRDDHFKEIEDLDQVRW